MKKPTKVKGYDQILDKKLVGEKIYYLVVKGRTKKWINFEQLDDYLDLVIEFEN